jgi:hypothetical protein
MELAPGTIHATLNLRRTLPLQCVLCAEHFETLRSINHRNLLAINFYWTQRGSWDAALHQALVDIEVETTPCQCNFDIRNHLH